MTTVTNDKPLSQAIAETADLIDCVAQREAYRRATELVGPALRCVGAPAGAMDGWTAAPIEALG